MDRKQESMLRLNQNLNRLLQMSKAKSGEFLPGSEDMFSETKNFENISIEDFLDVVNEQVIMIMELLDDDKSVDYEEIEERIAGLEEENDRLLVQLESLLNAPAAKPEDGDTFEIIKGIIEMRETMYARIDWSEDNLTDDNSIKMLNTQLKETAKILQNAGVTIYEDADEFDVSMCTVVETVETDDDELVGKIVKVFRPGYEYKGEILKSKEVIIYVKRVG